MADYFSMLPESLIHHILSFLPFKEISRTCVLSKYFNTIWCNYPNLDFEFVKLREYKQHLDQVFIDDVEKSLGECLVRRPFIQQLRLCFMDYYNMNNLTPRLDRWLSMSIEKNVSMLVLNGWSSHCYSIPQQVLVAPTLKVLNLCNCALEEDRIVSVELPRLEKLSLKSCYFAGNGNNLVQKILCGSPKMKHISLKDCLGLGSCLCVSCPPLTKHLILRYGYEFERIKIDAPSLETFTYESHNVACTVDLSSCTNLKELVMFEGVGTVLEHLPSVFLSIQVLKLYNCCLRKKYKISSQSLERLILDGSYRLNNVEIDAPNLKSLEFSLLNNLSSRIKFSSWRIHQKADDIHMVFSAKGFRKAWRARLQDFLVNLPNYHHLKLLIYDNDMNVIIMIKELHDVSFPYLQKLAKKHMSIDIFISSRDEANLVYDLSERYLGLGSPMLIICTLQSAQMFCKKVEKVGRWSILRDKLGLVVELVPPVELLLQEEMSYITSVWESYLKSYNHNAAMVKMHAYKTPPEYLWMNLI